MRKNDDVVHLEEWVVGLHGLRAGDIETGAADNALLKSLGKVGLVDDGTSGGVDEDGVLLHELELVHVHEALSVLVEGAVNGNKVGLLEEVLLREVLVAHLLGLGVALRIGVDDSAAPAAESLGDLKTDLTHTDDTDGLAHEVEAAVAERLPGAPGALLDGVDGGDEATRGAEEESNGELSDGVVEDTGGVAAEDATLLAGSDIEVVEADGHGGDLAMRNGRGDVQS